MPGAIRRRRSTQARSARRGRCWSSAATEARASKRNIKRLASPAASFLRAFLERRAEGMRGIDAEYLHLLGEEGELLKCQHQLAIFRVTFDVGVELGGEEIALDHVALELGHVDAVGGEAAQRLVERGRHIAHAEQECGDNRSGLARR